MTAWERSEAYDVWHDRATFHVLTDPTDRAAYAERVFRAVRPGGHVIIGTFALDGPERCSGLPVVRYDAAAISKILGPSFDIGEAAPTLIKHQREQFSASSSLASKDCTSTHFSLRVSVTIQDRDDFPEAREVRLRPKIRKVA